ncbi:probable starch synthase 4, chloroplastic/amyloplastic isoform X2 [Punica granatum]|uniref:starch synthase n=1 Tax=Punica granatum TaxID=22663 RepID=A0A6P8CMH7_PUNGR|nr:probable starch synthase 4, chloroplastic/amyloplastic isoform X2 [Punica granatum]XP_031385467.1 probable starch synthase 4, chloroplastic/amyloplastic isoform X2 [Punica granatum]
MGTRLRRDFNLLMWNRKQSRRTFGGFSKRLNKVFYFLVFPFLFSSYLAVQLWCQFILRWSLSDILYLNKQRIKALEELDRAYREKQLLLDKIEQLEAKKQAGVGRDNLSICWELLLRIDSMVLTGLVNVEEASNLRKLIMESRAITADIFSGILDKRHAELLAEVRNFANGSRRKGFHIVHICTEMEPLVSIGSLASYVTGLSRALQRKGHMVEVILPKYASLDLDKVEGLREIKAESYSYFNGQLRGNRIWTGVIYGIGVTFIEPLYYSSFFNRDRVYGYSDDFERFIYFSRASLDYLVKSGKKPDVIHVHNWETSVVGPLFWDIFVKQGLESTRIVLTCHDLQSQCLEQPDKLALCGLDPAQLHRPDRLQDNAKASLVNLLKGGVVYSNKVVIVSSFHSKGRIIRDFSHGLEPTLAIHKEKLLVTPPGFDNSKWDPFTDRFLPKTYSADNMEGKVVCKVALQQQVTLPANASVALVGCILEEVSDIDLKALKKIIWGNTKKNVQFIFTRMGKMQSPDKVLESFVEEVKDKNVRFINRDDEALLHLICAGSDIILCPQHDPVHQVPLKALKYGAAPIALIADDDRFRHFVDHEYETSKYSRFIPSTFGNMSISQAIDEMISNPSKWKRNIAEAMEKDFSWDAECSNVHISAYEAVKNL